MKFPKHGTPKRWLPAGILVGLLLCGTQAVHATQPNPYSTVQTLPVSGEEEAAYIDEKTTQFFQPQAASRPSAADYEVPVGWTRENLSVNGVPVEKYTFGRRDTKRTVLFLHGGGYVGGLHDRYRDWGIHWAELAGNATLLAVDYRLAPRYAYPSALEDAAAAYRGLLAAGYDAGSIVLMGDSAGGNLAMALMLRLRDEGLPLPRAAVLISPWGDLGDGLPSHRSNLQKDKVLGEKNMRLGGEIKHPSYASGARLTAPYVSPIYADLTGLPPLLITVGGDELFLDDAALLDAHARAAGVEVRTSVYPGMSHDWTLLLPELPESRTMNEEIAKFMAAHLR